MNKKIKIIFFTTLLVLLCVPFLIEIVKKINTNLFIKHVEKALLQANVNYIKNQDIPNYEFYTIYTEEVPDEFKFNKIDSGDLKIQNGKVMLALYNNISDKCAFKEYNDDEITLVDMDDGYYCRIFMMEEENIEAQFGFDKKTQTIISYNGPSDVIIPETIDGISVLKIGEKAFSNKHITSVLIKDNIKEIEKRAFMDNDITEVIIESAGIIIDEEAFMNNLIEKLDIKNAVYGKDCFKNNQLNDEKAFIVNDDILVSYAGKNRNKIVIPDGIKSLEATFDNLGINGLFSTGSTLEKIPDDLFLNEKLDTVIIGNKVKNIGKRAFMNNKITNLIFQSAINIDEYAFANNKITIMVLPNNLKRIEKGSFINNELTTIKFNSQLDYIGEEAFMDNWLTSLNVKVKEIARKAFMNNLIEKINVECNKYGIDSFKNNQLSDADAYITNDNVLVSYGGKKRYNLVIPDNVKVVEATLDNLGLNGSFDFKNVTVIPDNLLANNRITNVIMDKVLVIGNNALANNLIKKIDIAPTTKEIGTTALNGNPLEVINVKGKAGLNNFTTLGNSWNGNCLNILYELKSSAI